MIDGLCAYIKDVKSRLSQKDQQIAELKQSQNQKAIEELEKVKQKLMELGQSDYLYSCLIKVFDFVNDQLEELRGEENG